jgi:hypothetical protein
MPPAAGECPSADRPAPSLLPLDPWLHIDPYFVAVTAGRHGLDRPNIDEMLRRSVGVWFSSRLFVMVGAEARACGTLS